MNQNCRELIELVKKYNPLADFDMIERAYNIAEKAHCDQKRFSGEPYIVHPYQVAIILAELEQDTQSITAGLLHDVIEDTDTSLEEIREQFGEDVALLVEGVTKLAKIPYTCKEEQQIEYL